MGRSKKKIMWSGDGVDYANRKGLKPKKLDQGPYWVFNLLLRCDGVESPKHVPTL